MKQLKNVKVEHSRCISITLNVAATDGKCDDLEEFAVMVNGHDLTYAYSDDGSVWRNGQYQENRIIEAASSFISKM